MNTARNTGLTQRSLWTCESSDGTALADTLTSFTADSPARTSAQPGIETALFAARDLAYGQSSGVLLARFDPDTSLWRMSGGLSPRLKKKMGRYDPQTHSWLLVSWPRWAMCAGQELYLLPTPEPLTSARDGGLWPTPDATDTTQRQPGNVHVTRKGTVRHRNRRGGQSFMRLSQTVKYWASPTAQDRNNHPAQIGRNRRGYGAKISQQVKYWATPQARDYRRGSRPRHARIKRKLAQGWSLNLNDQAGDGYLNPEWDALLMGYPPGWFDPNLLCRERLSTRGNRRVSYRRTAKARTMLRRLERLETRSMSLSHMRCLSPCERRRARRIMKRRCR